MKTNKQILYFVVFLLTGAIVRVQAQEIQAEDCPVQSIQFGHYLNSVGKNNLSLFVEKYNVKIAEAGVIAARVMPDPALTFEASEDVYKAELGYTLA